MMYIVLFFFIAFIVAHAWEHAHDSTVNHYRATWTRMCVGSFPVLFAFQMQDLKAVVIMCFLVIAVFWIVFDIARNVFAGQHPLYIGGTASIDKLGRKSPLIYYFLKFFAFVSTVGTYLQYQYL